MQTVDAFLCLHATSMCELFMPFNRTLIVIASTRYEIGRHDKTSWMLWNENLRRIASHPHNTVAANNRYDQEYIKYFTGIKNVLLLPNACGYIKDRYSYHHAPPLKDLSDNSIPLDNRESTTTVPAASAPLRGAAPVVSVSLNKAVLIAPARGVSVELSRQLQSALQQYTSTATTTTTTTPPTTSAHASSFSTAAASSSTPSLSFSHIRDLYPHFQYSDLAAHPAIVILPYQVSFMSLFEFYRMEIPLFVPSLDLLTDWHMTHKVSLLALPP